MYSVFLKRSPYAVRCVIDKRWLLLSGSAFRKTGVLYEIDLYPMPSQNMVIRAQ